MEPFIPHLTKRITTTGYVIFISLSLGGAFVAGVLADRHFFSTSAVVQDLSPVEVRESGYSFINPLLECEIVDNQGNTKLSTIKEKVTSIIEQKKEQEISLYYRDLLNGPWYGYNENASFAPQSLLKLPIIFAYLKIADEKPEILDSEIQYNQEIKSNLPDTKKLAVNEAYTVKTLIERTITLSDNAAFNLLVENLPPQFVEKVHADLNIPYPSLTTPTDFVSVKSYSSVFRVLYNSSYVSRKNSEYLLELLSKSDFETGIVAGIPSDITVAHKFGVRNASDSTNTHQLHDCGIVYHPDHPYLICVMTKGNDQEKQSQTIQELSQAVYNSINAQN